MIVLSNLPCERCVYFKKIKTLDMKKEKQYISCKKAKNDNATELLVKAKGRILCKYFKEV